LLVFSNICTMKGLKAEAESNRNIDKGSIVDTVETNRSFFKNFADLDT
jgi:hypothetical protein